MSNEQQNTGCESESCESVDNETSADSLELGSDSQEDFVRDEGESKEIASIVEQAQRPQLSDDVLRKIDRDDFLQTPWMQFAFKCAWKGLSMVGQRRFASWVFRSSLSFVDASEVAGVAGYVALTLDDAPARLGAAHCLTSKVCEMLAETRCKATFFVCTDFIRGNEQVMERLCSEGHELANHCPADRRYDQDSRVDFEAALDESERVIKTFQPAGSRFFRPPGGILSSTMQGVIEEKGFQSVLSDCYPNDVLIQDPVWLANFVLDHVQDGSIIVLHMPERGFREWNLETIRLVLQGLRDKGLTSVTLSHLMRLSATPI